MAINGDPNQKSSTAVLDPEKIQHHSPHKAATETQDNDPLGPYDWPSWRKITIGVICSTSQLITTMSASMIAPALGDMNRELNIDATTGQIVLSIFFLGIGVAPMFIAPLSEIYGRRPVWLVGNAFFILWNSLCPVGSTAGMMLVGRLLSSCGASVGVLLTAPVLSDMYHARDRGKSLAIAGLLPFLGTALGPLVGGLAAQHLHWSWLFWIISLFNAACLALGYFFMPETYGPVLLSRTGGIAVTGRTVSLRDRLVPQMILPFRYLVTMPAVLICAFASAVELGTYTLALSTYATLWINEYGASPTAASLHYIPISLGTILGAQLGGPMMDFFWRFLSRRASSQSADEGGNGDETDQEETQGVPEFRVPHMVAGAAPGTAGLFLFAWAAELRWHWLVVDVGAALFAAGSLMFFQGLLAYLVDEFGSKRAASSGAALRLPCYLLAFVFPVFAPSLESELGYGLGYSVLAIVFGVVCAMTAVVLWCYGERLRAVGRREEEGF